MPDTLHVEHSQRVDLDDFRFAVDDTPQALLRHQTANLFTNPAGQRAWIVSGFAMSNPTAKQLRVDRGVAILSAREKGQVVHGMLASEGDAQKILDLNAYAQATYGVYLRFELPDGDLGNRVHWNPTTDTEFTKNKATRRKASWGLRVESVSPGAEWFQIGSVVVGASSLTPVPQRQFYFEGIEASSYARSWGSGNDRNADRATHGVKDLRTMLDALTKKVEEIQSGTNPNVTTKRWWESPSSSLDDMLSLGGNSPANPVRGNVHLAGSLVAGNIDISSAVAMFEGGVGIELYDDGALKLFGAHPDIEVRVATAAALSRVHWYETGLESTKFFDVGYDASSNAGRLKLGAGGKAVFNFNEVEIALLTDDFSGGGRAAFIMNGDVMPAPFATNDYDLGGALAYYRAAYVNKLHADTALVLSSPMTPDAIGADTLGTSAAPFDANLRYTSLRSSGYVDLASALNPTVGDTTVLDKLTRKHVTKSWGTLTSAGGSSQVVTRTDGVNVGAATVRGTTGADVEVIDVTFATPLPTNTYAVIVNVSQGPGGGPADGRLYVANAFNKTTTGFSLRAHDITPNVDLNFYTTACVLEFIVHG